MDERQKLKRDRKRTAGVERLKKDGREIGKRERYRETGRDKRETGEILKKDR